MRIKREKIREKGKERREKKRRRKREKDILAEMFKISKSSCILNLYDIDI